MAITEYFLIGISIVIALTGVLLSWSLYKKHDLAGDDIVRKKLGRLYTAMQNKFNVDEIYESALLRPFVAAGRGIIMSIDKYVIDGFVNGLGSVTLMAGNLLKKVQTGFAGHYALVIVIGVIAILSFLMFY